MEKMIGEHIQVLQNSSTNVVKNVKYGSRVYLTKNGHGQIAMIDMKELDEMEKELALYRFRIEMEKGERSIMEEGTITSD